VKYLIIINTKSFFSLILWYLVSSLSTTSLEDVAAVGSGVRWFQLYVLKDRQYTMRLVRRAERAGYTALVLTVDTPILGSREADHRNAFCLPKDLVLEHYRDELSDAHLPSQEGQSGLNSFATRNLDASLTWRDLTWLCSQTTLPVIVKGVLRGSDAVRAIECGARAIIVSNHGARQLDTVPATIQVLPDIVRTLKEHHITTEVYLDGGIRRGTDVLKGINHFFSLLTFSVPLICLNEQFHCGLTFFVLMWSVGIGRKSGFCWSSRFMVPFTFCSLFISLCRFS
jgi:isopentenyl diphosphate isomerase/L-lactate dehydrogenase-like FMN-dependent dehydrogenase